MIEIGKTVSVSVDRGNGDIYNVIGTITEINEDGTFTLDNGSLIYPKLCQIVEATNVTNISNAKSVREQKEADLRTLARIRSMADHPAGRGR